PVTHDYSEELIGHGPQTIQLAMGTQFEDAEGNLPLADGLTITNKASLLHATVQLENCSGQICSFQIDPADGFQGPIQLKYRIKAGGLNSNISTIYLDVPSPNLGFELSWVGSPAFDSECRLTVPASTDANCGAGGCDYTSAYLPTSITNTAVMADTT